AYRQHMRMHGVGLVTTEMVSAHGLVRHNQRTRRYLEFVPEERPIAVQLFGDTPEVMARAAELVLGSPWPPDILDINMGCPVRKVMRTGAGAALLGDLARAEKVAAAVVQVASQAGVPVTVKLRSGLRQGEVVAVDLARRLEAVGVQGLGVHPRTADQHYRGRADHAVTAAVVQAVKIPVMASGDIVGWEAAKAVLEQTGAAAVMVARGAAGRPWLVRELL
ncbi:MAG: tRNA-dihydrouridine synthase family protein, partial [Thermoleophilia bacterium]|nr:tRNA-dihydrouridine synthase family protein [Thermoleophilia bacterium]